MSKELLDNGTRAIHFYTLNLEKSVLQILEGLQLIDPDVRRPLPWRAVSNLILFIYLLNLLDLSLI